MQTVMIIGAGDIGQALAKKLEHTCRVVIASRSNPNPACTHFITLDIEDTTCVHTIAQCILDQNIQCVINTLGILHKPPYFPEKTVTAVDAEWFMENMRVNCLFTLLLLGRLTQVLPKDFPLKYIAFSARVSSISDNQLGGWVSYRASKAALNMVIKTVAIEWQRRLPAACVIAYHPGTVSTKLSKLYLGGAKKSMTPETAADYLLALIDTLIPTMSGDLYDWQQTKIAF